MAGYPQGGDSLSITKGIVSRVVMTRYAHSSNKLLGIQIDAAINPGNSVLGDHLIGLHLGARSIIRNRVAEAACDARQLAQSKALYVLGRFERIGAMCAHPAARARA